MVRKPLLVILLMAALTAGHVLAQSPVPPPGFFTALADLSVQVNRNLTLTCSDPSDGSTCAMSDSTLAWSWSQSFYADSSLGCPGTAASVAGRRLGNQYTFTYNGVQYDYREDLTTGTIILCTDTGGTIVEVAPAVPATNPPASDAPPPTADAAPASPPSANDCSLTARLQVGSTGRVITAGFPSNVRNVPNIDGALLGEMPPGSSFLVLEGPVCATTLLWYRVDHNGLIGWAAEGGGADYWLEPISTTATGQSIVPVSVGNVGNLQEIFSDGLASNGTISVYSAVSNTLIVANGGQLDFYSMTTATGQPITSNAVDGNAVVALTINNAGTRLVSLQNDETSGMLRFWDVQSGPTIASFGELPISSGRPSWIKIDPTGTFLAVGIESQGTYRVEVYDLTVSPLVPAPLVQSAPPVSMDFLSSGGTLAVMGSDSFITFYTTSNYQISRSLLGYGYVSDQSTGIASAISLTPNGQLLALLSSDPSTGDNVVEVWDLLLTRVLWTSRLPADASDSASDLDTSPDASLVMVAHTNGVILHDLASGTTLRQIEGTNLTRAFFDANGRVHLIGGSEGAFIWRVWGVAGQ
jgi:WD40 repeat protein